MHENDVFLVIDVQNDFCRGGALAVGGADDIIPLINELGNERFSHVIQTQDWHPPGHLSFASAHPGRRPFENIMLPYEEQCLWPDHCVWNTRGAGFHRGLELPKTELVIRKGFRPGIDSYSAFYENDRKTTTGLAGYLWERGIKRLWLAGLATDFCVLNTALDARKEGFEVMVIGDACCGINLNGSIIGALAEMSAAGVKLLKSTEIPNE